jgi:hypothetical protein
MMEEGRRESSLSNCDEKKTFRFDFLAVGFSK